MKHIKVFGIICLVSCLLACGGTKHNLSSGDDTELFNPIMTEYGVDLFVKRIDGKGSQV